MKDFTYSIIGKGTDGKSVELNCANSLLQFCKQSRFKTEEAARKGLKRDLQMAKVYGVEIIKWTLYSDTTGTIETSKQ